MHHGDSDSVWVKMMVIVAVNIVYTHKDVLFTPVTHIHLANILSSSGHKNSIAQPKADKCLSSTSHCPLFCCSLSVLVLHLIVHRLVVL